MVPENESPGACTIDDAAGRLKVPRDEVEALIAAGTLKTTGSGDSLRITPDSLLIHLSSQLSADLKRATAPRPGALAIAGSVLLPVLLMLWVMALAVEVFSLHGHHPIAPLPAVIVVLAAVLALSWWLARQESDFHSTNGIGTTIYGRRQTPEGRIGTEWLIVVSIPLLPVRSYVILDVGETTQKWVGSARKTSFRVKPLPRIHWPQALPILVAVWVGIAAVLAVAALA